jgi:predicted phosphodiesterase
LPTPPRSDDQKLSIKNRVEAKLREGFRPPGLNGPGHAALAIAGQEAVRDREYASVNTFLSAARDLQGTEFEPDWGIYRAQRYQQPVPLSVTHPATVPMALTPSGRPQRILAIGDLHQDPRHPERLPIMTWLARLASEHRPDRIIQIGDWSTWDSVNQHDDNSTEAARFKPKIKDDLDNLLQSHQAFRAGMAEDYRPKLDIVLGNHENRLERFENANPEAVGTYTLARDETYAQFGWRTRPYGELFYVEGVAFTHHPTNGAGRAYGGKTGPQRAANESTVPVVSGHTHRRQVHDSPKIGPIDVISMVEIGCGLPWGTVEAYAKHGLTGWWYGAVLMTVQGGVITDLNFISMPSIEARYSDAARAA